MDRQVGLLRRHCSPQRAGIETELKPEIISLDSGSFCISSCVPRHVLLAQVHFVEFLMRLLCTVAKLPSSQLRKVLQAGEEKKI
jgi:hypothetical protein